MLNDLISDIRKLLFEKKWIQRVLIAAIQATEVQPNIIGNIWMTS